MISAVRQNNQNYQTKAQNFKQRTFVPDMDRGISICEGAIAPTKFSRIKSFLASFIEPKSAPTGMNYQAPPDNGITHTIKGSSMTF